MLCAYTNFAKPNLNRFGSPEQTFHTAPNNSVTTLGECVHRTRDALASLLPSLALLPARLANSPIPRLEPPTHVGQHATNNL